MVPKSLYAPNDPLGTASSQYHLLKVNAFNAWNVNKGYWLLAVPNGSFGAYNDFGTMCGSAYNKIPVDNNLLIIFSIGKLDE